MVELIDKFRLGGDDKTDDDGDSDGYSDIEEYKQEIRRSLDGLEVKEQETEDYPIEEKPRCSAILNRDDFTCQLCGHEPDKDEPMESVLMGFDEGQEDPERDVTNYATLCQDCARNHRAGLTKVQLQQQRQVNSRQYTRGEKTEGQLRALPALMMAMAMFLFPPVTYDILFVQDAEMSLAWVVNFIYGFLLWPIATWFWLMVGSWVEPHEGIMSKIRIWVGGIIYYDIYKRLVKPAILKLV